MNEQKIYECDSIETYLEVIREIKNKHANPHMVYRGEIENWGSSKCCPNIFRKEGFRNNDYYEKNILDEMTANRISVGESYLLKAMNAQHGGFPSRLLDISFNALVALHFAINPHYTEYASKLSEYDSEDGFVYVIMFDEIYCAASKSVQDCYENIISRKNPKIIDQYVFSQNYKLIDHIKLNDRIIAQSGGFILFPGTEYHQMPNWMYETIRIKHSGKAYIRKDLKNFFGIDNGSMYPEPYNQVEIITNKSTHINNTNYSYDHELSLFLKFVEKEINHYITKVLWNNTIDILEKIRQLRIFEKKLSNYSQGLKNYINFEEDFQLNPMLSNDQARKLQTKVKNNKISKKNDYNLLLKSFREEIENYQKENNIIPIILQDYSI